MAIFSPGARAIMSREFRSYFMSPVGYIIIFLLVSATNFFMYVWEDFFGQNEASFRGLIGYYPWIIAFIAPLITMTSWAEEKRSGTEETLFTLPVSDLEVVTGKYMGALAIYTVAMLFHLVCNLLVLSYLGSPDMGLLISNYIGFFLVGAMLLAVGMVASAMTSSTIVAVILGILLCAAFVAPIPDESADRSGFIGAVLLGAILAFVSRRFSSRADVVVIAGVLGVAVGLVLWLWTPLTGTINYMVGFLGLQHYYESLGKAYINAESILYFVFMTGVMLYVNSLILSRRNW